MPYLIDGHNLIGQLPDISLDDPNDEAKLVQKLRGFAARTGKRITVIFDAGLPGGKSHLSNQPVEVIFASSPGIADRLLLNRIEAIRDPGNWTVISSDREVLGVAKRRGMRCITSAEFAQKLSAPARKPRRDGDKPPGDRPVSPAEVDYWLEIFGDEK